MIKVLIVDDSGVMRQALKRELSRIDDIEIVGTAVDAYDARDKIVALHPDVVTLDVEMPRIGGLTFLGKLMRYYPLPVIIVSTLTSSGSEVALKALEAGAVDVMAKPVSQEEIATLGPRLAEKIRAAAAAHVRAPAVHPSPTRPGGARQTLLTIGASTGGTEAIRHVLLGLPASVPATLIVQHMPEKFTDAFARRLNEQCAMEVREARDNDVPVEGLALIAPGNFHMMLKNEGGYRVGVKDGPPVHHQRPAVDVLFHSVARVARGKVISVLLTGMGADGARGMLSLREMGAHTIAQDEQSCVVFGMPKEAIAIHAAQEVLPLDRIARRIMQLVEQETPQPAGAV